MNSWRREKSHSPAMRACIGDASPTIFPRNFFFLLIFRMKHSIRMNEMLKSFIVHVQACVCACVVKLFPRMRTINFVPLTIHPQHSCMYSRAYTNTRPENSSWRLWCWWDPWSFKKIVCIKYTKKSTKNSSSNENILSFLSLTPLRIYTI